MEFQRQKAIYLQIADWLTEQILSGTYPEGTRLPSVRDCAAELEVNVNTVARTFEWLQQKNVVTVRRGLGNYVAVGARQSIFAMKREEFFAEQLPQLFNSMKVLDIPIEDVVEEYNKKNV